MQMKPAEGICYANAIMSSPLNDNKLHDIRKKSPVAMGK